MTILIKPAYITAYTVFLTSISAVATLASARDTADGYYCRIETQGVLEGIWGNGDLMAMILVSALIGAALSAPIYVLIGRRLNRRTIEVRKDDNGSAHNAS